MTISARHVMDRGGVVRKFESWGTLALPQRMKAHKQTHNIGEYVSPSEGALVYRADPSVQLLANEL